jgi:membrane fusion protein, multidrug efflux system
MMQLASFLVNVRVGHLAYGTTGKLAEAPSSGSRNSQVVTSNPDPVPDTSAASENKPGRHGRWWAAGLVALGLLSTAGYLLSQGKTTQKNASGKAGASPRAVPVAVTQAKQGDIGEYITALGAVTPVYTVTIKSRVDGQLMSIHYREGQLVQKGDLLAEIDPRPYQASALQAEGQLARDQAQLKNSQIDLERYKGIYAERAIPEQQLATQGATVLQNEGTVKLDQGLVDSAKVQLDYTKITSPITGRVGLRLVDPGNIVHAADTNGLLVITQLQPITVVFSIAEDYISEVVTQMRAGHALGVDALDRDQQKQLAHGSLLTLDNQIDNTTGTVKLKASFANQDNKLFPNQFVNAKLLVRMLHDVTLVPSAAVQRNAQMAYLYVLKPDQTVVSQKVTVATTDGNLSAVTGISRGATVVIDGFDKLQDGIKVTVRKPGPGSAPGTQDGDAAATQDGAAAPTAGTKQ